jgi:hypothetical protein
MIFQRQEVLFEDGQHSHSTAAAFLAFLYLFQQDLYITPILRQLNH